jgi:hypothetical protein
LEKANVIRIFVIFILAAAIAVLLFLNKTGIPEQIQHETVVAQSEYTISEVDSFVSVVLGKFQIDANSIKRSEISVNGQKRVERKVSLPLHIVPALVNVEFKRMAENYNLQVAATENLKENTVTIHIHDNRKIIETIILKITKGQQKQNRKEKSY